MTNKNITIIDFIGRELVNIDRLIILEKGITSNIRSGIKLGQEYRYLEIDS